MARSSMPLLIALALLALVPGATLSRELLVNVADSTQQPVTNLEPFTVMWNFSTTVDPLRGSWQIDESDPRISPDRYDGITPEQLKVIYYGRTQVAITWSTGNSTAYADDIKPLDLSDESSEVQLETPDGNVIVYTGDVDYYTYNYWALIPGALNYTSGVMHRVRIGSLVPGQTYKYRVGSAQSDVWSDQHTFAMPGDSNTYPMTFGLIGDVGQTYNSSTTYEHLLEHDPHMVIWLGDLSYSDTRYSNGTVEADRYNLTGASLPEGLNVATGYGTYQPRWDMWGRLIEPLTSSRPFVYIVGNHEIERQSDGTKWGCFSHRVPGNVDVSGSILYFSYDIGPVHWVFLTSYTDYHEDSEQYQWLIEDLENVDRDITPWVIVGQHAPVYNSYKAHYQEAECFRISIEPILYEYGVDLVFSGHVHAYERSFPVYNYTLDPLGPVHITVGDGGNVEKLEAVFADLPGYCPPPAKRKGNNYQPEYCLVEPYDGNFCSDGQPFWSAFREPSFGFGSLTVINSTTARFTWHRNQDNVDVIADEVYFTRNSMDTLEPALYSAESSD